MNWWCIHAIMLHSLQCGVTGRLSQVCLLTNPIWVIKTRLQLQRATSLRSSAAKVARRVPSTRASPYRGFTHAVRQIAREEGFAGFYRGLLPSLLLVSTQQPSCPCCAASKDITTSSWPPKVD